MADRTPPGGWPAPGRCPVCGDRLQIARLHCPTCETHVEGHFRASPFSALSREQLDFVETFLRARGNIREVERMLGISYPTVRGRLDAVLEAMGFRVEPQQDDDRAQSRREVLDKLSRGELTPDEAIRLLRQLN